MNARMHPGSTPQTSAGNLTRRIPFDNSFQFQLTGEPGKIQRSSVTISIEASFTAVSIGYGVVPEVTPVVFGVDPQIFTSKEITPSLRNVSWSQVLSSLQGSLTIAPDARNGMPILEAALRNGVKLNPDFARVAVQNDGNADLGDALSQLFQVVSPPPENVQFLYSLFDEGSGREFQSAPQLNISGLGAADGKRPFRYFAHPIEFAPLATIRMEIVEQSDFRGQLHVSLHGYKIIGGSSVATTRDRPRRHSRR
jgi:hypothetical protein